MTTNRLDVVIQEDRSKKFLLVQQMVARGGNLVLVKTVL